MTYTFSTGSGFLNSPPRVVLVGDDNRPGTYPVDISPAVAASSVQYTRPYRDNVFPDTPVPYARASVVFNAVPNEGETITLTNAKSQSQQFTFKLTSPIFEAGPSSYNVSYDGISATPREDDEGLTRGQVITKRALEKFIQAVNTATGTLITASPTSQYNKAILTQRIPGTVGNVSNSTTSADVTIGNFVSGTSDQVRYPFGITSAGSEVLQRVLSTQESGTLDVPASGKASTLSAYSDGHPYAVFQPYDESNAGQAFGISTGGSSLYGTQASLYSEFFTRGSVSGSLDEPLGAKDKIVIDLTPVESTTIKSKNTVNDNFHMMYFNHATKKWEKLGFGEYYLKDSPTLQQYLDRGYIGFGQFYNNIATNLSDATYSYDIFDEAQQFEYNLISSRGLKSSYAIFAESSFGSPIDTFGFPLHPKYHATASQQHSVDRLIDRPFLVEKFVYEFSGSSEKGSLPGASFPIQNGLNRAYRAPTGIFFILNQRKANPDPGQENSYTNVYVANRVGGFNLANTYNPPLIDSSESDSPSRSRVERYENGGIPSVRILSSGGPSVYVDTVRDLVTFARIGCVWPTYKQEVEDYVLPGSTHPAKVLDLAIDVPASGVMDGIYTVAADIKSPTYNPSLNLHIMNTGSTVGPSNIISLYAARDTSTRNALNVSTGRSYRAEFNSSKIDSSTTYAGGGTNIFTFTVSADYSNSPYLLLPGDNLVFGWQAQISNRTAQSTGTDYEGYPLTIGPGAGKLTLYGSYLQDDKPVHDIYKDQLNSDAAHEAIPAGPWVLDRFENEPQMCYSGSIREEHVTGTMVTRSSTGGLSVTSVNDFSIGGVRAVSARASAGTLGQRWSFFRNNRLIDSEEQYYDSMQPNPVDVLYYGGTRALLRPPTTASLPPYTVVPIMIPGEIYNAAPAAEWPTGINLWFADDFPEWISAVNSYSNRNIWDGSFPFESKYSAFERVKKIGTSLFAGENRPYFSYPQTYYGAGINGPTIAGTAPNMRVVDTNAKFGAAHVGRLIRITSAVPGNSGFFTITSVTTTQAFYTNVAGTAEAASLNLSYGVPTLEIPGTIELGNRAPNGGIMFFTGSSNGLRSPSILYSPGGLFKDSVPEPYGGAIPVSDYQALFPFTNRDIDTNPIATDTLVGSIDGNSENINYELSRFMGCFGSGFRQMIQYSSIGYAWPPYVYPNSLPSGARYRGCKHGLINPVPLFSNAVFNGTKFGQFRDMMEQRQYTRFSLSDNTLTEAAVSVQFINRNAPPGTLNITSGSATNSSNISKFATSEHPYDDALVDLEQIWDRSTSLPETLIAL